MTVKITMQPAALNHQNHNGKVQHSNQILTTNNMTINNKIVNSETITNKQNNLQNELKHHPGSPFYIPTSKNLPLHVEESMGHHDNEDLPAYNKYGKKLFKPVDLTSNNNNCKRFINNNTRSSGNNHKKLINKKYIIEEKNKLKNNSMTNGLVTHSAMDLDISENNINNETNRTLNSAIIEPSNSRLEREQCISNSILSRPGDRQLTIDERFHESGEDYNSDNSKSNKQCPTRIDMDVDIDRISPDPNDTVQHMDTSVREENNENLAKHNEQISNFNPRQESKDYSSVFQEHLKRNMRRLDTSDDEARHSPDQTLSPSHPVEKDQLNLSPKAHTTTEHSSHEQHQSIINCLQNNTPMHSSSRTGNKFNDKYDIVNLIKKENTKTAAELRPVTTPVSNDLASPINVTMSPRSSPSLTSSPAFSERIYESGDGETQQYFDDSKTTRQLKFSVDNILDPNKFTGKATSIETGVADHMSRITSNILIGQNILNSYKHLQNHWRPHLEFLSQHHQHDFINHSGKLIIF